MKLACGPLHTVLNSLCCFLPRGPLMKMGTTSLALWRLSAQSTVTTLAVLHVLLVSKRFSATLATLL